MNPTPPTPSVAPEPAPADPFAITLHVDPHRPIVAGAATLRHPERIRAAVLAFLQAVAPEPAPAPPPRRRSKAQPGFADPRLHARYNQARRDQAQALLVDSYRATPLRLPVAPILTVLDDAWTLEGFAADQSAYARLSVRAEALDAVTGVQPGTTSMTADRHAWRWFDALRATVRWSVRLHLVPPPLAGRPQPFAGPPGWLRGFAAVQAALSLPMRRVAIDRAGLFGLLGAIERAKPGRSIAVRWTPGGRAEAEVAPGARPVLLHARAVDDGSTGDLRVPAGPALRGLAGLLPWVEGAEVLMPGPDLLGVWSVRLAGGIGVVLALPGWTADGRLGALRADAVIPPSDASRFLLNQVVAGFREAPVQTRRQVVERTRGNEPAILAALNRLAAHGLLLPEPEGDRFRWRAAFDEAAAIPDDPEPPEVEAARAIARTESIAVSRDEPLPNGRGRRIEGLILDRPVTLEVDPDGRLRRGRCTCSHHEAGGLDRFGPCRHLLALQARAVDGFGSAPPPPDLAAWFAGFPA